MNYIYDITLNFNKTLYNFYEWNKDDDIDFYLKIPVLNIGTLLSHKSFGEFVYTTYVFVMNLGFTFSSFYGCVLTIYFNIKRYDYWYLGSLINNCLIFGFIFY